MIFLFSNYMSAAELPAQIRRTMLYRQAYGQHHGALFKATRNSMTAWDQ
jgi:hypothetical protein